ncbi:MAG: ATP-binding protein [Lachnospiraceae bacterium]|nr:ATP-binding protein [Lachnospiraceae bacterium]
MEYIHRTIEKKFKEFNSFFKVILLTGARQVGKSTMLNHLAKEEGINRTVISLDNIEALSLAKKDPALFFQRYPLPILIDEVQYAPELFGYIKFLVDQNEEPGQVWMTGSQQFLMMKNVRESLAGRIGLLQMYSLTKNEKDNIDFEKPLDFNMANMIDRVKITEKNNVVNIFDNIWNGGMPKIYKVQSQTLWENYLNGYVNTYLMRDVAELEGVVESLKFIKFLQACAALTSEQLNYKKLADITDISQQTAKKWINILVGLGIIYLLEPFYNNELKRLSKTPKLYFCDTGLCASLSAWTSKDSLLSGAVNGKYFENYVVMELIKNYSYSGNIVQFYYLRENNTKEIDILIQDGRQLHPIEIKLSASPKSSEVKKFAILKNTEYDLANGGIICMMDEVMPIDDKNCFIPANII